MLLSLPAQRLRSLKKLPAQNLVSKRATIILMSSEANRLLIQNRIMVTWFRFSFPPQGGMALATEASLCIQDKGIVLTMAEKQPT